MRALIIIVAHILNILVFCRIIGPFNVFAHGSSSTSRQDSLMGTDKPAFVPFDKEGGRNIWPAGDNASYYRGAVMKTKLGTIDSYRFDWPDYSKVFSMQDQLRINQIAGNPNANVFDAKSLASLLNTPEKVSAFLAWKFSYGHDHPDREPLSMVRRLRGVCYDQHIFASWVLNQAGYEAHCIASASPLYGGHTITVFREKNGGWNFLEFGRITWLHAESMQEALAIAIPDGVRFWETPAVGSPDDNKGAAFHHVIETPYGLAMKDFMNGLIGILPLSLGPAYAGGPNLQLDPQTRFFSATTSSGGTFGNKDLQFDTRIWYNGDPMLKTMFAGAIRWSTGWVDMMSAGILVLPNAYGLTVSSRYYKKQSMTTMFLGLQKEGRLIDANLDPERRITFDEDYDVHFNLAPTFTNDFSTDVAYHLSYVDLTSRSTLHLKASDNVILFASGSLWLSMMDMLAYWIQDGGFSGTPTNAFVETGMSYRPGNLKIDAEIYQPLWQYTNLLSDEPCWNLSGQYQFLGNLGLAADLQGHFDSRWIRSVYGGLTWSGISLGAGISQWMGDSDNFYLQASVDLAKFR